MSNAFELGIRYGIQVLGLCVHLCRIRGILVYWVEERWAGVGRNACNMIHSGTVGKKES